MKAEVSLKNLCTAIDKTVKIYVETDNFMENVLEQIFLLAVKVIKWNQIKIQQNQKNEAARIVSDW